MSKSLIIIGNGGHASVLTEILLSQNENIVGFTAPAAEENQFGLPYLGCDEDILTFPIHDYELVLGIGMVKPSPLRQTLFSYYTSLGYLFKNIVHPSAVLAPSVQLGVGVQIMAGAIIQTHTKVADNSIINTGAIIDHDCWIEQHTHISTGARVCGNVHIKQGTHVGAGATIIQGIKIGTKCLIGAGSVVVRDVPDCTKVIGVPAKDV